MIEVFIPDYIIQILNSQHGWIFMVINNQYYDWGFQSRFSATAIIFINGHDLFYNGGNSPESLQAYNPALGGYIIQVEITSNMQVPCHCQQAPWHLGANAKSVFAHFIEDPTHHIVMSRPLGTTNCSCQTIQDNSRMTRLHYYDYSRLMGATQLDFI